MALFIVTIFVCNMALSQAYCNEETAISTTVRDARNEFECNSNPQRLIAQSAIKPREGEEYLKFTCHHINQKSASN